MAIKIAIHHHPGSFSDRWIEYCKLNSVAFRLVDCYRSDIIEELRDCDGLMWHWHHADPKAVLFARQLIYSLEAIGKKVFPDSNTAWHFDDKVGQKYLLEAVDAPLVASTVFYERDKALEWARKCIYPQVFKLRVGAGSRNVRLIGNFRDAKKVIRRSFGKGFLQSDPVNEVMERLQRFRNGPSLYSLVRLLKGFGRVIFKDPFSSLGLREKGYVLFQDFIPGNKFDIRIVTIGNKSFALKRIVRPGDFRASGSGKIDYVGNEIGTECARIAFETSRKIKSQCMAYDFVFGLDSRPVLVEMSYAFSMLAYDKCPGYWDPELVWHESAINAPFLMIENFIASLNTV